MTRKAEKKFECGSKFWLGSSAYDLYCSILKSETRRVVFRERTLAKSHYPALILGLAWQPIILNVLLGFDIRFLPPDCDLWNFNPGSFGLSPPLTGLGSGKVQAGIVMNFSERNRKASVAGVPPKAAGGAALPWWPIIRGLLCSGHFVASKWGKMWAKCVTCEVWHFSICPSRRRKWWERGLCAGPPD